MKLKEKVILVFKNEENQTLKLETTIKDVLEKTIEDFYDDIEPPCTSASCNNESQNFCDCGAVYENYKIVEVNLAS